MIKQVEFVLGKARKMRIGKNTERTVYVYRDLVKMDTGYALYSQTTSPDREYIFYISTIWTLKECSEEKHAIITPISFQVFH